jgi:hypothetical protein
VYNINLVSGSVEKGEDVSMADNELVVEEEEDDDDFC